MLCSSMRAGVRVGLAAWLCLVWRMCAFRTARTATDMLHGLIHVWRPVSLAVTESRSWIGWLDINPEGQYHSTLCACPGPPAQGLQFVVDNTFSPMLLSPARWGADIVGHSLTTFISGASDSGAGARPAARAARPPQPHPAGCG